MLFNYKYIDAVYFRFEMFFDAFSDRIKFNYSISEPSNIFKKMSFLSTLSNVWIHNVDNDDINCFFKEN